MIRSIALLHQHQRERHPRRPRGELIEVEPADVALANRHGFIQNLRRGFYDLGTDVPPTSRLADAFAELGLVI
ncbi:MAG: hypothetical protein ACRDHM_08015 [Actinomycetota bacterium]